MPKGDTYKVRLFLLPPNTRPEDKPVEVSGFTVQAANHDRARDEVLARARAYGYETVRSLSSLADDSADFALVVVDVKK